MTSMTDHQGARISSENCLSRRLLLSTVQTTTITATKSESIVHSLKLSLS